MNTVSDEPVTLRNIDGSKAEISFCLFPQSANDEGFLHRFLSEEIVVEPVWNDKRDGVNEDGKGRAGARFRVVVQKKSPEPASAPSAKKKATKKAVVAEKSARPVSETSK